MARVAAGQLVLSIAGAAACVAVLSFSGGGLALLGLAAAFAAIGLQPRLAPDARRPFLACGVTLVAIAAAQLTFRLLWAR